MALVKNCVTAVYKALPSSCVLCALNAGSTYSLCSYCENAMPFLLRYCRRCGIEFHGQSPHGMICGSCLLSPPAFKLCRGLFRYQSPIDKLISDFKFEGQFAPMQALSHLLAKEFESYYPREQRPQLLIPVPLHNLRLRQRGFNQSLEIARKLAKQCQIPIARSLLIRTRDTTPQIGLKSAAARKSNLRNAFAVSNSNSKALLSSLDFVAIVDDVVTTTATVAALSRCLLNTGVSRVDVWSLARASRR